MIGTFICEVHLYCLQEAFYSVEILADVFEVYDLLKIHLSNSE